jgi:hypothetical protein
VHLVSLPGLYSGYQLFDITALLRPAGEVCTIAIRIGLTILGPLPELNKAINFTQALTWGLSLVTNLIATLTVTRKAW